MSGPANALLTPLRLIPNTLHTSVLAHAFNHLLRGQALASRLTELEGKRFCLDVTDIKCRCHFLIEQGRLQAAEQNQADVTIRGQLRDFILLATRREDPDTLFFSRRLCLEGDTETGLHFKNLLDALEFNWEAHINDVLGPRLGRHAIPMLRNNPISMLLARGRGH